MDDPRLDGIKREPTIGGTPKPRAGEHTPMTSKLIDDMLHAGGIPRCDEWDKLVRHSRALETSVYRGISDIERIEAERDLLRERLADLVEVADVSFRNDLGHMLSHEDTVLESARAALAKVRP